MHSSKTAWQARHRTLLSLLLQLSISKVQAKKNKSRASVPEMASNLITPKWQRKTTFRWVLKPTLRNLVWDKINCVTLLSKSTWIALKNLMRHHSPSQQLYLKCSLTSKMLSTWVHLLRVNHKPHNFQEALTRWWMVQLKKISQLVQYFASWLITQQQRNLPPPLQQRMKMIARAGSYFPTNNNHLQQTKKQ